MNLNITKRRIIPGEITFIHKLDHLWLGVNSRESSIMITNTCASVVTHLALLESFVESIAKGNIGLALAAENGIYV